MPVTAAFMEDTEAFKQSALQADPDNVVVLCAASHACIKVFDRPEQAVALARRALQRSRSNPFALDVLADALWLQGKAEEAYAFAKRAHYVGQVTPLSHFFGMGLCLACLATGRLEEALTLAQQASALAPSFRPPLRYAAILSASSRRL